MAVFFFHWLLSNVDTGRLSRSIVNNIFSLLFRRKKQSIRRENLDIIHFSFVVDMIIDIDDVTMIEIFCFFFILLKIFK